MVALISDRLYQAVPEVHAEEFEAVRVEVKTYQRPAWLWTGGTRRHAPSAPAPEPVSPRREIVVIDGGDNQAYQAIATLLRALGLVPIRIAGRSFAYREAIVQPLLATRPGALVLLTDDVPMFVAESAAELLVSQRGRTLLVDFGDGAPFPAFPEVERLRLDTGSSVFLYRLIRRLLDNGYSVDATGSRVDSELLAGLEAFR